MKERSRAVNKANLGKKRIIEHWEIISLYLLLYDVIVINLSYFLGLWVRFDLKFSTIPKEYLHAFLEFTPYYTIFCIIIFYSLRLYKSLWRYASYNELNRILVAVCITTIAQIAGITVFLQRMPVSYYIIGAVMQAFFVTAVRFSYRFITMERAKRAKKGTAVNNAMVIGAGAAGRIIIRELNNAKETNIKACCAIDDNSNKWGRFIEGVPIVGGRSYILSAVKKYDVHKIFMAMPTASLEDRRDILNICKETGCELKSLPGVYQLMNGEVSLNKMKPVAIEDLLGRETIKVNTEEVYNSIQNKTVLITGGGGSIGSEISRLVASHEPKRLIIFDIYENNAYDIEQELRKKYPQLQLDVLIGSVRDSRRVNMVFETYKPEIVFHAAAHKHVPLMEHSPNEAIKNNVIGTYKTAYAAMKNGTQRFVLISTDKAVNPTNIMGASKRLCEMVIQSMDVISQQGRTDILPFLHAHNDKTINHRAALNDKMQMGTRDKKRHRTQFVAVRFGNVLGSNGSVIPLFKKQIEEGGPVTVTHPDIIRYFMTIPEAVSLVLQASANCKHGSIYVLDMGSPVKIDDLAKNLINLSGYKVGEDIKIEYVGLRPGEKLYEEKLMAEEGLTKTENDLIHIAKPIPFDVEVFFKQLEELAEASYENSDDIVEMVEEMVTTFHPVGDKPTGKELEKTG